MSDIFQEKAQRLIDEAGVSSIEECLLLCVGGAMKAVSLWLDERYKQQPGEQVPQASIPGALSASRFWLLDRRMPERQIIEELARRGVIAESRTIGQLAAIYVPPQGVAAQRAARWN
jgi:hypothetical protein